jgi:hypothetical protein
VLAYRDVIGEVCLSDLSFPAAEFEGRLAAIRDKMKAAGLDALILTRGENIFYASGFRASHFASWLSELHALIVPAQGAPRLMTRALEREIAKLQWTGSPQLYLDHENPYELLVKILRESGNETKTIGIEERVLKVSQFRRIQQHLPGARLVDASGLVEGVAASPSQAESDCLRRAARITDIGFQAGVRELREGIYPYEVIGKIHAAMYQAGQRDFDMSLVCVWSGPQGGRMHDTSTTERITKGDIVTLEVWGVDNHYKAGAQASIYIGDNPPANIVAALRPQRRNACQGAEGGRGRGHRGRRLCCRQFGLSRGARYELFSTLRRLDGPYRLHDRSGQRPPGYPQARDGLARADAGRRSRSSDLCQHGHGHRAGLRGVDLAALAVEDGVLASRRQRAP